MNWFASNIEASLEAWFGSVTVLYDGDPAARAREMVEAIREQELQKALSRMGPDLSARERKVVEALSKGIINKILHTPVTNLRAPQPRPQRHAALNVIQALFELNDPSDF